MRNELVQIWEDNINKGKTTKKKWRDSFRVDDLDKYWEGVQQPNWWPDNNFIVINLIFANIKTQLDGFRSVTPKFHVRPARTFTPSLQTVQLLSQQSQLREAVLNYHVRESGFKREMQKVILDSFISFGVAKTFYNPYHRSNPNAGEPITGPDGSSVFDKNGYIEKEASTELYKENFLVQRRNPDDILFDPFADSIETIEWIAERIEMTVEEVKQNKLFKNTADIRAFEVRQEDKEQEQVRKIGDNIARPMTGGNSSLPGTVDRRREIVYVWEIYDLVDNRIICLAEGFDKELRNDSIPDGIEGHPYCFMWFIDRRNSPYPIPYIWHQLGPQDEYNITRNQIITHRKRFNRKYTVKEGDIDDTELSKLEEPYDGVIIKVKGDGKVIAAIEDPSLDQAVYFDTNMLRKDFMDVAGEVIPETDIAQIEKATVAQLVSNRQENRKRGVIGSVSDFLEQVARKLITLYENELTLPMLISIVGETGKEWINLNPQALQSGHGEFFYEVAADSLVPQTPETERAAWVAFTQFAAMNPQIALSPVLLEKTGKMFGVEDKTLIAELQQAAMRIIEQQKLQGGQPGQPSMSGDMAKTLGM